MVGLMGDEFDKQIAREIEGLATLEVTDLRVEWRRVLGKTVPYLKPSADLLRRDVAHAWQTSEFGGPSLFARRQLAALGKTDLVYGSGKGRTPSASFKSELKPGTALHKTWHGELHEVMVLPLGFGYRGKTYGSLSKIAREITGTRWSGPAFFGLKKKEKRVAIKSDASVKASPASETLVEDAS